MNKGKLIEVLSISTYSGEEDRMINYLSGVLDEKQLDYTIDPIGNIYVTKGESKSYPCFVSHTDTVHKINERLEVYTNSDGHLQGRDSSDWTPLGIGGDDKCGIYLCLEMLEQLEYVKVAFFVGEEIGMIGSKEACPKFFSNVKYAIQFDSPEGNTMSMTLMRKPLFEPKSLFGTTISHVIKQRGITKLQHHPYTDVYQLMIKFDIPCLNLAAGYYQYHTQNEYVVINDVENTRKLAIELVDSLENINFLLEN